MQRNRTFADFLRLVTFSEFRKTFIGPVQFQLLVLATFFLPFGLKYLYSLGIPRPVTDVQYWAVKLVSIGTLAISYCILCWFLSIPPFRDRSVD